ncbi:MAG: hypothetical protein QGF36_04530 [Candidatus Marinimicrobia bacterium]|jgi:hypothetical protein|nr:hypothetical protein [Candidatus Neomarinimicrobiota bacterium]MDP6853101.1 hypothetical protein [Candidatus Neomarinimicrobiota bacterium]MDP6936679.1 hypothetical protein [Candidatus Neomarinimicrobiota bacterium]|tara:strand:- start:244 stop:1095 length:852 start_codon:yes stop_codon:yes gene_type:complete
MTAELIGAWVVVFLTLSIFSYLFDDNPFYKAAEHLFIGVSAGYWAVISFWQQIQPNLFGRLWPDLESLAGEKTLLQSIWYGIYEVLNFVTTGFGLLDRSVFPEGGIEGYDEIRFIYIIPFILGIFMLLRLVPKVGWLARWAIAYIVGMTAGLRFYSFLNSDILSQIKASAVNFSSDWGTMINGLIVFIGTLTGLIYFFFSKEHKGSFGTLSKIGIYFLMIKFGASFGFAVMGRISLLIGRINALKDYSAAEYNYATPIILGIIIITLIIWSLKGNRNQSELTG